MKISALFNESSTEIILSPESEVERKILELMQGMPEASIFAEMENSYPSFLKSLSLKLKPKE